ncbi:MAG: hypothetical protein PHQ86_05295 [Dehalococcoidales bacterium]|nr:hypothetical protein [Dehalococcoidales bacterium]
MPENTRIRININTGEIEFEGTEDFVKNQLENLPTLIESISTFIPTKQESLQKQEEAPQNSEATNTNELIIPDNFGEFLNSFPKQLQQTDKALIAGYYQQKCSQANNFETSQVNKLLLDQSIKIANASTSLKSLATSKYIFPLPPRGRLKVYRVSNDGVDYLKTLKRN